MPVGDRRCRRCTGVFPASDFAETSEICPACHRAQRKAQWARFRNRNLGLPLGVLEELMDSPCSVCHKAFADGGARGTVHLDANGHPRAVVCRKCARGMGLMLNDPEIIGRARAFLLGDQMLSP